MSDNTTRQVNESADKIQVNTALKRGSGTRDEDKVKVRVKGDDPDEVVAKLNATIENLTETHDNLRQIQPGDDE